MKGLIFSILFSSLIIGCENGSTSIIESCLEIELPKDYQILKHSNELSGVEGWEDEKYIELKFSSKNDFLELSEIFSSLDSMSNDKSDYFFSKEDENHYFWSRENEMAFIELNFDSSILKFHYARL